MPKVKNVRLKGTIYFSDTNPISGKSKTITLKPGQEAVISDSAFEDLKDSTNLFVRGCLLAVGEDGLVLDSITTVNTLTDSQVQEIAKITAIKEFSKRVEAIDSVVTLERIIRNVTTLKQKQMINERIRTLNDDSSE